VAKYNKITEKKMLRNQFVFGDLDDLVACSQPEI
jgi:hypothetical protein